MSNKKRFYNKQSLFSRRINSGWPAAFLCLALALILTTSTVLASGGVSFNATHFSVYALVGTLENTLQATDGQTYRVTVSYSEEAQIPEGSTLSVSEISPEEYEDYTAKAAEAIGSQAGFISYARFFDITILHNGQAIQPAVPVDVKISLLTEEAVENENNAETSAQVVHFGEEAQVVEPETHAVTDAAGMSALANGGDAARESVEVSFEAEGFSVYGVVYTVDFHYDVDGKLYQFNLPGGGAASFTDLVEVLGVIGNTGTDENHSENAAEAVESTDTADSEGTEESGTNTATNIELASSDESVSYTAKEFVANIESLEFSSPELVWVGKADVDTTVAALKEMNNLESAYSTELTEEQIEEINNTAVAAGDWTLISLQPFDTEETLTVTMKDGEAFTVRVTDAQISTEYLSASGNLYEVTVIYGEDAKIPEGASLQVTEYSKYAEEYRTVRKTVLGDENAASLEETNVESEAEASGEETFVDPTYVRELVLEALDITILDQNGNPIEPEAPVEVRILMKQLPEDMDLFKETASIQHLNTSSGQVQVETVADTDRIGGITVSARTVAADFTLDSFSQFTITYYQNNPRVVVNVHYVDTNGTELTGTTGGVTTQITETIILSSYQNEMNQTGYTYLGAHYGTYDGQVITSLQGTTNSSGSLSSSSYIVEFRNGDNVVARQEYEGNKRQVDVYLVYAPSSGYYIQDTIGEDGCLTVKNGTEVVQTGTDQNLFVRWLRYNSEVEEFQEVTQSKILNGVYNIPVLGGPKVNVAIDEGADQDYKAEIYKVENNQEVPLGTTSVYHVPYYDDVRNGGFETPHNPGGTNENEKRWPSNWQVENGQRGVIWKTTGIATDGSKRDIEIPQGADTNGDGANDVAETLRNYCFAFMPEGNQCAELNCEASGSLYQDVLTIPGSQIYWSLYHRARGGYDTWKNVTDKTQNRATDTMYVVAMPKDLAEKYDVTTQAKVLEILQHVNDSGSEFHDVEIVKITTTNQGDGTITFMNHNVSLTVPPTYFGNLGNGTKTVYDAGNTDNWGRAIQYKYGNTDWHYYTGNFSIPANQYLTRFFFVAGETASNNPTMGNFLDDIRLSDSVPSPNYGQATVIIQKTVEGLDTLPTNYATRIETKYKVTNFNNEWHEISKDSDYDSYRTVIGTDGRAVSTASWTFPITIENGVDSIVFTKGEETEPKNEEKTDIVEHYTQTTSYIIRKQSANQSEPVVIAQGTGKKIPEGEIQQLEVHEKDVIYIEFINTYKPKHKLSIWKTDPAGNVINSGASFALYHASDFNDDTQKPKANAEAIISGTTGENGILSLDELSEGEYRLLETKAPDGYIPLTSAVKITVTETGVSAVQGTSTLDIDEKGEIHWVAGQDDSTHQIRVWNNPGVELPATGGSGTNLFYLFGIMLTALAGAGFVMKRQRKNAA